MDMKTVCFDLDDTICYLESKPETWEDYAKCKPIQKTIAIVNELARKGYKIKIFTARGMGFFKEDVLLIECFLGPLTRRWLNNNNVHYDELLFGKTHYNIIIDDKALNVKDLENTDQVERNIKEYASSMYRSR